MKRYYAIVILSLISFISCAREEERAFQTEVPTSKEPSDAQGCTNLSRMPSDSSLGIFPEAADMWSRSFLFQYEVDDDPTDLTYNFQAPAATVASWLKSHGNDSLYFEGMMAYIGLDTIVQDLGEIQYQMCLILTLYKNDKDTVLPTNAGPFVKLKPGGQMQAVDSVTAQTYIDNWSAHYSNVDAAFMVPVYAYSLPISTLWEQIVDAQSNSADGNIYIILGCHTISPGDEQYCVKNAKGFQHVPALYGYGIVNFVLATKVEDKFQRSSDFLRPCPRFCGTSLFQLSHGG